MTAKMIDGKAIATTIKQDLKIEIAKLVTKGQRPPCLAVVLVGNDPASEVYVGHKKKSCANAGIKSVSLELPGTITQDELAGHLSKLNHDDSIDGILLQLPLPAHLDPESVIDLIDPSKDVDGLTPFNQGLLVWRRPGLVSCTPAGVMELLKSTGVDLVGKRAVVMGRSVLVGAPMATLLSNAGATVNSLNSQTINGPEITKNAEILVVATGVHHLVKADHVKPGAIVIDVGMHRHEGKLSGDVDFETVKNVASYITPVPGGVGPMTIAMLLRNCLQAYLDRKSY